MRRTARLLSGIAALGLCVSWPALAEEAPAFKQAEASATIAGYSLSKVQRWLHEVALKKIEPDTGLYHPDGAFNYQDAWADCYPFLVWAAWTTDLEALNGPVRKALHAEIAHCPEGFFTKPENVYGGSEYVKDGLVAIVEVTGKDEWFERMKAIEEDVWKHAPIETPYGKIPSENIEVNGEQLQVLARLYAMTGEKKFLTWAERLADYYLKPGNFVPTRLRDHGCEITGGLGLLLAVESTACPEKFKEYEPHFRYMCDEIIRRGTNSDGIIIAQLQSTPGPHDKVKLGDGWGYNYVAFLDYDMATGQDCYRKKIEFAMSNLLKPRYRNFNWDHNSRDNIADSVEGGLYLLNRLPVKEGFQWADREIAKTLVDESNPNRLWGTHKLESNTVRTVLIHALMHTRGLLARPWQQGFALGAAEAEHGLTIVIRSDKPWSGRLVFDIPRHRLYMGFARDWPRMNTLPEWFTVEPNASYTVSDLAAGSRATYTGAQLHAGLAIEVKGGGEVRLLVSPAPAPTTRAP